jgi:glutamate N-acetyltransferase/amino-acid N-acetyltransferase
VVINTRIANACTGEEGFRNARAFAELAEGQLGLGANTMMCMSTGVIGQQLPLDKLDKGVLMLSETLDSSTDGWTRAAAGMLTTDTRPKHGHVTSSDGYVIGGCIKGAGMINPNMATMLSVICTDAAVSQPCLQSALTHAAARSFNACTIDGDTSTNDTAVVLSNGASGVKIDREDSPLYTNFRDSLAELCEVLAVEMIRDGEGVTKLVTVRVVNAPTSGDAHRVCKTIAHSMLVKTALFGGDANWGRIMAAVGRSGVAVDPLNCSLHVGPFRVFQNGRPEPLISERELSDVMKKPDVTLTVSLGTGTASGQVFTCDLSLDYVSINADYRS